jgi:DNA recombination protein RmuC
MAQKDVDLILTSSDKLTKRGSRIEALEFAQLKNDAEQAGSPRSEEPASSISEPAPKFEPRSSTLKLRVVDEDD